MSRGGPPHVLAFSLEGTAQLPKTDPAASTPPSSGRFGTSAQVKQGKALYARYCAHCHGEETVNTGPLPDLKFAKQLGDSAEWKRVVYAGLLGTKGMPGFLAELSTADVEAVRAYIVDQAIAMRSNASSNTSARAAVPQQ